ncbi:rRNA small subunit 7-methylguanosine (m7G) methyltransferase GidB [Cutibacterium acnes JCM 18909]|nr:rRNA small subunit 7-methylguanosine (m7G) methyltransferase GidB [Cutibacterium acnes JCM 18909]
MFGMTLVSDDAIAERLYRDNYKTIRKYVDILASRGVDWGLIGLGRLADCGSAHPEQYCS